MALNVNARLIGNDLKNVQKIAILACNLPKLVYGMCVVQRRVPNHKAKET